MAIMNFSHLLKNDGDVNALPEKKEIKPPKIEKSVLQPTNDLNSKKFSMNDKIVESRFCYGCSQFSVDRPDTPTQKMFCKRSETDGSILFKFIKPNVMVKQCPMKHRAQDLT